MSVFKRDTLRSPQLKKKKRNALYVVSALFAVVGGILCFSLSAVSKMDALEITDIETEGNVIVGREEIVRIVDEATAGKYFGLFSKRNVALYPKELIATTLLMEYPIIASAELETEELNILKVRIAERSPHALWCKEIEGSFTDECFFLDSEGYIYAEAPEFKGSVYSKFYGRVDGDALRQNFLTPSEFARLWNFVEGAKGLELTPIHVVAKNDGEIEIHLRGGGRILMTLRDDLDATLINLEAVLKENFGKRPESAIEYIDLRFGNKIFFKLRE